MERYVTVQKPLDARAAWLMGANRHGSTFRLSAGRQAIEGAVPGAASWWGRPKTVRVGRLRLPKGRVKLAMQPLRVQSPGSFGIIRRIILAPTRGCGKSSR